MGAYKDKNNNTWYVKFYYVDFTGTRRQTTKRGFEKKIDALEYELTFKKKKARCIDVTIKEFVEIYFVDKDNQLKKRTIVNKRKMIDKHIIPYLGSRKIRDITTSDITAWQNVIRTKNYSECYQHMLQNQVRALFNHAEKIYNLKDNPMKGVDPLGKPNREKGDFDYWTLDEYEKFIGALRKDTRFRYRRFVIIEVLFWTGIRVGELLSLCQNDIDLCNKKIYVRNTYYRHEQEDILTSPKTVTSKRVIEIPEFLANEIREYYDKECIPEMLSKDARIFELGIRAIEKAFSEEIERQSAHKIRIHDLRHSHVSYLINVQKEDIAIISKRLGHKSVTITWDTYSHLYPDAQRSVADRMDAIRNPSK